MLHNFIMSLLTPSFGAEVAKAVGCKVEDVDKEFVLGLILQSSNISIEDKARLKLRGKRFLADIIGRQK